jgi:hypothetical protein
MTCYDVKMISSWQKKIIEIIAYDNHNISIGKFWRKLV